MRSCAIIPQVKNKVTDKIEDSQLYINLLQYTVNDRNLANDIYYRAINPDFINSNNIELDEHDEPTFDSLHKVGQLDTFIGQSNVILNIKKELNLLTENNQDKEFNTQQEAFDISEIFNNTHVLKNEYIALPKRIMNNVTKVISYVVDFIKNTLTNQQYQMAYQLNNELRTIITQKFKSAGINVGAITEAERRQGVLGVIDFDSMHQTDKTMVEAVRIAAGERGTDALLEEHIHFLVDVKRDDPLIQRAYYLIKNNDLTEEILGKEFDNYEKQYGEDSEKLIYEAVGKVIYDQIKGIKTNSQTSFLVNRAWTSIKNWANKLFSNNPLTVTKVTLQSFTINSYLSPKQQEFLHRSNTQLSGKMFQLKSLQNKNKDIAVALENVFQYESQRLKINKKQNPNNKHLDNIITVKNLKSYLDRNTPIATAYGATNYIINISKSIEAIETKYNSAKDNIDGIGSITPLARVISELDTFVQMSNKTIAPLVLSLKNDVSLDDILITVNDKQETFGDIKERLITLLNDYNSKLSSLKIDLLEESKNILVTFYGKYLNENPSMLESVRKCYEKTYQIIIDDKNKPPLEIANEAAELILSKGLTDLGWYSRLALTASQAPDFFIQLNDDIIKQNQQQELFANINDTNEFKALRKQVEQKGSKDDKFMFERDNKGNLTGYAICKGHWGNYITAQTAEYEALDKAVKDGEMDENTVSILKYQWYQANTSIDEFGNTIPNPSIYPNSAYNKLSASQKEYHMAMINKKTILDKRLPGKYFQPYLCPQIMQDLFNSVFKSDGIKGATKNIVNRFKDEFLIREDDTGFGDLDVTTNIDGSYLKTIPIYFTRKLQDMSQLNMDFAGNMIAYSMMVNHYNQFNELADVLVLSKDILKKRTYAVKNKQNKISKVLGYKGENEYIKEVTKENSNTFSKFNQLIDTNIYDVTKVFEGNVGKINIAKAGDALLKFNSMNKMGFNVLSQITNVLNSRWQTFIEAIGGEVFGIKDLKWSDTEFAKQFPHLVSECGQRIKQNKITLMHNFFNIRMEHNGSINRNMNQKNLASKVLNSDMFYMLNNMAEFHAYSIVMLSVARRTKVYDTINKKEISLYDAIKLDDVMQGKNLGKKVRISDGIVQSKDNQIPIDNNYLFRIGRQMQGLGKDMFGVYSPGEKTEVNKYLIGRAAMQFRGYFIPNMQRRFGKKFYNSDYGHDVEGYYITLGKILINSYRDILKLNFIAAGQNLDEHDKANIKKALTELGMFTMLIISSILLGKMGDDDDELERENWLYNVAYYSTVRLGSEVGAFLPFTMLLELQRQISSPIPGVSVFEMIGNLTSPQKFLRTVDRGFWKDHLYLEQYASYFIPGVKSILTASDVSTMRDQRRFFQNQGFSFDWITLSPDKER
jgi:hypothetical protein